MIAGMTETAARERWCPFARTRWAKRNEGGGYSTSHGDAAFNRVQIERSDEDEITVSRCVASHCMAWRTTGAARSGSEVQMHGLARVTRTTLVERTGCCGLAGAAGLSDAEPIARPADPAPATGSEGA